MVADIHLFGFQRAVSLHNILAIALVTLIVFAIFWHVTLPHSYSAM